MSTDTKAVSAASVTAVTTDLADFFSATEARTDRWRQLNAVIRAWQSAAGNDTDDTKHYADAVALFGDVAVLEAFFAYPGPKVMSAIEQALAERNAGVCARLVQSVSGALMTETYRTDPSAWDPLRPPKICPVGSSWPAATHLAWTPVKARRMASWLPDSIAWLTAACSGAERAVLLHSCI